MKANYLMKIIDKYMQIYTFSESCRFSFIECSENRMSTGIPQLYKGIGCIMK